ncbi:phosphatase PAP2 family protein [Chryseobacterium sp. CT-SW4]|uniref:phosphatase PAP2 family protein n=1 Tax=Chryseobacterium sp. SW-1 TaxID=3157343 RepID=UPI003B0259FB
MKLKAIPKNKHLFSGLFFILLLAFMLLTGFIALEPPQSTDIRVSKLIQEQHSNSLNTLMQSISWMGKTSVASVLVTITIILLAAFRYKKEALLISGTLISSGLCLLLKILINRPRPTTDFAIILEDAKFQSFPSGHTLFYTVFFGSIIIIIYYHKKMNKVLKAFLITFFIFLIFLGGISRIYLGAHWFSDVMGSLLLGIMFLMVTGYYYRRSILAERGGLYFTD